MIGSGRMKDLSSYSFTDPSQGKSQPGTLEDLGAEENRGI